MRGLLRLAESFVEASATFAEPWQYALPIDVLRSHSGLTNDDLRWLLAEGFAEHRLETTRDGSSNRAFRRAGPLNLTGRACFTLTTKGLKKAQSLCQTIQAPRDAQALPCWDAATGRWMLGGALVKHLKSSAQSQRTLLDACHAAGWENPIANPWADMPLPRRSAYLSHVLNHLMEHHADARIWFSSRDKGRCFHWSILPLGPISS